MDTIVESSRRHLPFLCVLAAGALVRVAYSLAYWPALMFDDSWAYLRLAWGANPVGLAPDRPSGYPLAIKLLTVPGHALGIVVTAQHIAGLLIGVVLYALLLRLAVPRWLATVGAALVLLDAYVIAMEQYVMPETLFTLCVLVSAYLVLGERPGLARFAASGGLLALAVTIRTAALFVVPVWLLYVLWRRPGTTAVASWSGSIVLVLLASLLLQGASLKMNPTSSQGWFLYGRVAGFASCGDHDIPADARALCPGGPLRHRPPTFYVWSTSSPANHAFPSGATGWDAHADSVLRAFAEGVIEDQPLDYVGKVLHDLGSHFGDLGAQAGTDPPGLPIHGTKEVKGETQAQTLRKYLPGTHWPNVRWPSSIVHGYQDVFHTQGWLIFMLCLAALGAFVSGLLPQARSWAGRRLEVLTLAAGGLALLVGPDVTVGATARYLMPALPLLIAAGTLALSELAAARQRGGSALRSSSTVLGGDVAAP